MNDLVKRLRDPKKEGACWCCQEAADRIDFLDASFRALGREKRDADAEIERLSSENEAMRKGLTFYALDDNWSYSVGEAIFHPADEYGSGPRWAKEALGLVSEEQPPDTCPECHGTGKTVINKHIGVENCPECSRDSEGQCLHTAIEHGPECPCNECAAMYPNEQKR